MKKILITGSNGLLGQKLTDLYRTKADRDLMATGTGPNRNPEKKGYSYADMDITDFPRVREVVSAFMPDCIIHGAAMTNVDACEFEKEKCIAINVQAVEYLAQLCAEFNIHLIHISTDFIFPGTKQMYLETDVPQPLSFYGESKLRGEEKIQEFATKWAILRTVLVYGLVADMSRSNIVLWAYNALKSGQNVNVVDDQFRTPTLAEDLALGCFLAEKRGGSGVFNISGKDYMSIFELVQRVAAFFHFDMRNVNRVKSHTLNQPAKRPPITGLDITKARLELGYEPMSFEEGLAVIAKAIIQ